MFLFEQVARHSIKLISLKDCFTREKGKRRNNTGGPRVLLLFRFPGISKVQVEGSGTNISPQAYTIPVHETNWMVQCPIPVFPKAQKHRPGKRLNSDFDTALTQNGKWNNSRPENLSER